MTKLTTNPPLYFDTDCLSAFLWIENESILTQLYPGRVIIPKQVYDELSSVPRLQGRIDTLLGSLAAEKRHHLPSAKRSMESWQATIFGILHSTSRSINFSIRRLVIF